jgi:hypothetical protein
MSYRQTGSLWRAGAQDAGSLRDLGRRNVGARGVAGAKAIMRIPSKAGAESLLY